MALLEVRNLVKHFPLPQSRDVVHAVNDVSFSIEEGETLALVGESGSGKTTVGRCILRLLNVTSGEIEFLGRPISSIPTAEFRPYRAEMQTVFQEPFEALNPRWRAGDTIQEPLRYQGKLDDKARRRRVYELLDMVRLSSEDFDRFPHQLSGGQQQRVGIARAIATNPKLVVLDEPTSALDISVRAEIINLLADLQRETNVAYLFISHDLTAVRRIASRVAIMYLGKIVETSTTEDIFNKQIHPYGKALLSSVLYPDPDQERSTFQLYGEIPSPIHLPSGCYLAPRCPLAQERNTLSQPPLEQVDPQRAVACFRWQEIVAAGGVEKLIGTGDVIEEAPVS
ncbi:MAG: ABC transporter ATP-binding protein [Dehalococcoidia bacterium]